MVYLMDQEFYAYYKLITLIEKAQEKFNTGSSEVKRGILSTLGSNLVIKDKRVSVDIEKSILPLRRISKDVMKLKKRLEPLNNEDKQAQFEQSCIENPVVLRVLDDVRTSLISISDLNWFRIVKTW